jgi:Asp-tRNA(Asn)/Glu-tRNA(Gln) amidotransferase A subunit family amidase
MIRDAIDEENKRVAKEAFVGALAGFLLAATDNVDSPAHRTALAGARAKAKELMSLDEYDAAVFEGFRAAGFKP